MALFPKRLAMPTPGTRFAVWLFPAYTLWLAYAYAFGPMSRLQGAAYTVAANDTHLGIRGWGYVFLLVGLFKMGCILRGTPNGFIVAMVAGMGLYTTWSFLFAASIYADPATSLTAPAPSLFVLGSHMAFMATITRKKG